MQYQRPIIHTQPPGLICSRFIKVLWTF